MRLYLIFIISMFIYNIYTRYQDNKYDFTYKTIKHYKGKVTNIYHNKGYSGIMFLYIGTSEHWTYTTDKNYTITEYDPIYNIGDKIYEEEEIEIKTLKSDLPH